MSAAFERETTDILQLLLAAGMYDEHTDSGEAHWNCMRKVRHATYAEAEEERLERLDRISGAIRLFIYPCPTCGGFHLTKKGRK